MSSKKSFPKKKRERKREKTLTIIREKQTSTTIIGEKQNKTSNHDKIIISQ